MTKDILERKRRELENSQRQREVDSRLDPLLISLNRNIGRQSYTLRLCLVIGNRRIDGFLTDGSAFRQDFLSALPSNHNKENEDLYLHLTDTRINDADSLPGIYRFAISDIEAWTCTIW